MSDENETVLSLIEDRLYDKWRTRASWEFFWDPPKDSLKLPVDTVSLAKAEAQAKSEWIEKRVSKDRNMLVDRLFKAMFDKFDSFIQDDD